VLIYHSHNLPPPLFPFLWQSIPQTHHSCTARLHHAHIHGRTACHFEERKRSTMTQSWLAILHVSSRYSEREGLDDISRYSPDSMKTGECKSLCARRLQDSNILCSMYTPTSPHPYLPSILPYSHKQRTHAHALLIPPQHPFFHIPPRPADGRGT